MHSRLMRLWPRREMLCGKAGRKTFRMLYLDELIYQLIRNLAERLRLRTIWTGYYSGLARVCIGADLRVQRDVPEQLDAHFFAFASCSCLRSVSGNATRYTKARRTVETKDVMLVAAIGADEGAHVLDHAQDRHIDFLEEVDTSHSISQSKVLRRGNDHSP